MNRQESYDKAKLYPVQRRLATRPLEKVVEADDNNEDGNESNSIINGGKDSAGPDANNTNHNVNNKATRDYSRTTSAQSLWKMSRKFSWLPASSFVGPDGRRQSVYVDYGFFENMAGNLQLKNSKESFLKMTARRIRVRGLHEMTEATSVAVKIFWLLLFLTCFAILVYEMIVGVNDYYRSPIATTFTINNPPAIRFPDVYICMGNAINRSYVLQHPEVIDATQYIYASLVGGAKKRRRRRSIHEQVENYYSMPWEWTLEDYVSRLKRDADQFEEELESEPELERRDRRSAIDRKAVDEAAERLRNETLEKWQNDGEVAYDFLMNAGFDVSQTFRKCSFQGYKHHSYDCNKIIHAVLDPNNFKCFVVNIPADEQQVLATKGLQLQINTQVSLYPRSNNESKPNKYAGIFVSVIDKFDPTNWYKSVVAPGTYTKISLSATHVHLLNIETASLKQPCVTDGTELYHIFNTSYSRTACQMDCLLFAFYKECNCIQWMDKSLIRSDILESVPFCAFKQSQSCLVPKVTNSTAIMKKVEKCRSKCHTQCDSTRYEMRGSWSKLNPRAFPLGDPVHDLVQLDIAFGKMEVSELIQSISKTPAQLVADMGGQINLWLGASLILLLEIPIFVISYGLYQFYHKLVDLAWAGR